MDTGLGPAFKKKPFRPGEKIEEIAMKIMQALEDLSVQVAYAEANAWEVSPIKHNQGDNDRMNTPKQNKSKRARARVAVFGLLSAALYAAVFTHADLVMKYFTKGGINCLLPVASVFVFSYVHGSFASNLWTALGIEASKSVTQRKEAPAVKRPQTDNRPRVNA